MHWLVPVGLLAAILLLAWAARRVARFEHLSRQRRPQSSGVRGLRAICSAGELRFLATLESAVPDGTRVVCKVRMADVIDAYGGDLRSVAQKHFDFVVVESKTFAPLLAVELDDKSHLTAAAQRADAVKDSMCERAGLRLLRVKVRASYDLRSLARSVAAELIPLN